MTDGFGREITYLRVSVTELCNLRCRYCMPEEGVCKRSHAEMMTEDETIAAIGTAASLGINKIRITGGEPLVKRNILSICRRAAALPGIREICLTTNGVLLEEMAKPLYDAGVRRVNVSLDTLDEEKYAYITRRRELHRAMDGLAAALATGFDRVKVNTVLIGGFNDDEIPALAELTRKYDIDLRFIELMPMVDSEVFPKAAFLSCAEVTARLPEAVAVEDDGGVAKLYRLPGAKGCVGVISPMSAHFCGKCNRLRLTADGKLKPCLHSAEEYSIKGLGREEMKAQFERAIMAKPRRHKDLSADDRSDAGRSMNRIGG